MSTRVIVLGELLCDLFGPRPGVDIADAAHLVPHPGGAPANAAAQLARLGARVSLVTAVGDDALGERCLRALTAQGVDTRHVARRAGRRTGLTLVEVDADGERRFTPWRQDSADLTLTPAEVDVALAEPFAALLTGTVSLRRDPARRATRRAVASARRAGAFVALDVNLRGRMFPKREQLLALARRAARRAHIVKATVPEARALWGRGAPVTLARRALEAGARVVALTDGPGDAWLVTRTDALRVTPPRVHARDATGAGDAFFGALLFDLLRAAQHPADLDALDEERLRAALLRACFAGARATTKVGATSAMPRRLPR
jgi:fructokinase